MRFSFVAAIFFSQVFPALTRDFVDTGMEANQVVPELEQKADVTAKVATNKGSRNLRSHLEKSSPSMISTLGKQVHVDTDDFILKNESSADDSNRKECLLTSDDADIGVSSCGVGNYCQESSESKLGGVCSPIARMTATESLPLDRTTTFKNGPVCRTVCSITICVTTTLIRTYVNDTIVTSEVIYDVKEPYRTKIIEIFHFAPEVSLSNTPCTYSIDGVTCGTCQGHFKDCTSIGGLKGRYGSAIIEAFEASSGPFCTLAHLTPSNPRVGAGGNKNGGKKGGTIIGHPAPIISPPTPMMSPVMLPPPSATASPMMAPPPLPSASTTLAGGPPKSPNKTGKN